MTIKDKKEIINVFTSRFRNDIYDKINKYEEDIYNMDNFDIIMKKIMEKQKSIKTIKDLIKLEDYYYDLEKWFLHNELYYTYDKYLDYNFINKTIEFLLNKNLKDCEFVDIELAFRKIRKMINNEVKEIDISFLFKDFHDYVDKVWEGL